MQIQKLKYSVAIKPESRLHADVFIRCLHMGYAAPRTDSYEVQYTHSVKKLFPPVQCLLHKQN